MAKTSSDWVGFASRGVKIVMVALLVPVLIGLVHGIVEELSRIALWGGTVFDWVSRGFLTYLGIHILLWRPEALFRAGHTIFSTVAVWLFGGQVATVEADTTATGRKRGRSVEAQGSPLVAFSPYVVPLYPLLICAASWAAAHWWDPSFFTGPVCYLFGLALAFHWLMTAEDLQEQRKQWHMETYLLAIGLIFLFTLVVSAGGIPWVVPDISLSQALRSGWHHTQELFRAVLMLLFHPV